MKNKIYILSIIFLIFLIIIVAHNYQPALSQEERQIELTAQGILARVDKILAYPTGLMKGSLKHIMPDGKSYSITLTGYISSSD